MTLSPAPTDAEDMLARAQNGEAEALDAVAREHRRAAYLFALQLVGNPDDALDISQDAMLRFFSTLDRFQPGRPVRPWVFAIVRNCARDFWRRKKVRRHVSIDETIPDLSLALSDTSSNPETDSLARERHQRVWRAISRLPTAKREILVLRDFHDLSYAEIARVLKIPVGTVMSRLHAARQKLREEILLAQRRDTPRTAP